MSHFTNTYPRKFAASCLPSQTNENSANCIDGVPYIFNVVLLKKPNAGKVASYSQSTNITYGTCIVLYSSGYRQPFDPHSPCTLLGCEPQREHALACQSTRKNLAITTTSGRASECQPTMMAHSWVLEMVIKDKIGGFAMDGLPPPVCYDFSSAKEALDHGPVSIAHAHRSKASVAVERVHLGFSPLH